MHLGTAVPTSLLLAVACAGVSRGPATGAAPALPLAGIRWVGRVDARDPAAVRLGWQGAGLVATVRGPRIAVRLRSAGATVFFQPVVDGVAGDRIRVDAGGERTVALASGLAEADHVVELYRDTDGLQPVATFLGFTAGEVTGAPPSSGRLLEVVGDSISAGYGNLGSETHPGWSNALMCIGASENSSWYRTYGAVAGRALSAEVSTLALPGWGLSEDNTDGRTNVLGKVYGHALGAVDPTPWTFPRAPQAVVVNLGTNDQAYGLDQAGYVQAGLELVTQLRSHAPEAWVFFVIGSTLNEPALSTIKTAQRAIVDERRAQGDARIEHFDLGTQPLGSSGEVPTGCQWHPGLAEHQRMARLLEEHLRQRLGW